MAFVSKQLRAFGLDISDSSVKVMLMGKKGKSIRPESFNAEIFPRGIVVRDEIKDSEKLAEIIKKSLAEAKPRAINIPYVISSLPESKSFIRMFELPAMKKSEVAEAVKWEAEQHIPMSVDQVEIDWEIIDEPQKIEKKKKGLQLTSKKPEEKSHPWKIFLTASPKSTITPIIRVLKTAGLQPVALEIESLSTVRSCLGPNLAKKNVLFVDIGTNRTGLTIVSRGIIRFTSSLAIAGVDISKNIIKHTGYSFREAEKAKIKNGLDQNKQSEDITKAIEEVLTKIVTEIKNTIRYHREHSNNGEEDSRIDKILICGGTARLTGLDSFITKSLGIRTELANPWASIYTPGAREIPPISSTDSLSFTTVIGLAERGINFTI